MAYTQGQLDALQEALARGVLIAVLPDGSRVEYRSVADMERIIHAIKVELGQRNPAQNVTYPTHRRGFDT